MSVEFHGNHKTVAKLRCIWTPSVFGILLDLKKLCLSYCINMTCNYLLPELLKVDMFVFGHLTHTVHF